MDEPLPPLLPTLPKLLGTEVQIPTAIPPRLSDVSDADAPVRMRSSVLDLAELDPSTLHMLDVEAQLSTPVAAESDLLKVPGEHQSKEDVLSETYQTREAFLQAELARLTREVCDMKRRMSTVSELTELATSECETGLGSMPVDDIDMMIRGASKEKSSVHSEEYINDVQCHPSTNISVIVGSALSKTRAMQAVIYTLAFAGVVFVLVAKATDLKLWAKDAEDGHRRLAAKTSILVTNIGFCVSGAGAVAFVVNFFRQPLILGYLLGGILVGPIGLQIVPSHEEIAEVSSLGLVFLLFMIGLELDVSELARMGKVVLLTGFIQFPLCAGVMTSIFMGLEAAGMSFGGGPYATLYCGVACSISSTMLVVKLLSEHAELHTSPGRLTIGILIFQDIWAIIVLAIQPDIADPQLVGLLKTFASIAVLVVTALTYAKFVMPAVFMVSSKSVELMLVVALAWCFLMGCFATLPFVGQSFELAALISGVALATFPYSAEFLGKIKYIRDFFITLFFVALGMQIPVPSVSVVSAALVVAVIVLVVRWLGIFSVVSLLGGGSRLATVATINLSQVSEFALVICSLGTSYGHVDGDTLTIIIWTFAMMAILSSYLIGYNYHLYGMLSRGWRSLMRRENHGRGDTRNDCEDAGEGDRNIVFLGIHKTAALLIAHFEHYNPCLLAKIHVIDSHEHIMPELRKRGITCAYGDISSPDVLEHSHYGDVRLVVSSVPNTMLRGVTNLQLLQNAKKVWPQADVIATATTPDEAHHLYENGADYVLRVMKLCAERLHDLILEHSTQTVHHQHIGEEMKLSHVFEHHRKMERLIPRGHSLIQKVAHPLAR